MSRPASDRTELGNVLRAMPSITYLLQSEIVDDAIGCYGRPQVTKWLRAAVDEVRHQLRMTEDVGATVARKVDDALRSSEGDGQTSESIDTRAAAAYVTDRMESDSKKLAMQVLHVFAKQLSELQNRRLRRVINATGVLLHTNLGRAPLADRAIARMNDVAGSSNLELDLSGGKRAARAERCCELLAELTGAEAAIVVNNCAAATMLSLAATSAGKTVIVSRGQLVEIGGGFRLPEVFEAAGVKLCEVGTTNRTYPRDYQSAVDEFTGAILRVHRSNFSQVGFCSEATTAECVAVAHQASLPMIDDVGSGCLFPIAHLGLDEPIVQDSVAAGADLVLFSGDKLFGGPQCGIIVGRRAWISKLTQNPFMRAVRADKLTLAALEATTELHVEGRTKTDLPLWEMIFRPIEELQSQSERLASSLPDNRLFNVAVCESDAPVGGGSLPGRTLPSRAVSIRAASGSQEDDERLVTKLARTLRLGETAIMGRLVDGQLLLDLRSVQPRDLRALTDLVSAGMNEAADHHATGKTCGEATG